MLGHALIIRYHGVGSGPAPLFVDPRLFRAQLECLADSGARTLTVTELVYALRARRVPPRSVALVFNDGFRCLAEEVAPLLAEHDFAATFFCVAGRLGARSDWPSTHRAFEHPLLTASELAELAEWGFEIGSHGMEHRRLDALPRDGLVREIGDSRAALEDVTGAPVQSFALPYGARPGPRGRSLIRKTYLAACGQRLGTVGLDTDLYDLATVDAHHLRRPGLLRRALAGSFPPYLRALRAGARARRMLLANESVPA
jgi:peptidoglycan/xylan/chitin deacetylase (PgdA/CDA1 family)